jgi:hypothetical protein
MLFTKYNKVELSSRKFMKIIMIFISLCFSSVLFATTIERKDIQSFQNKMDMNLTKGFHIARYQDLMDMNLTKRHHIRAYQRLSEQTCRTPWYITFFYKIFNNFTSAPKKQSCTGWYPAFRIFLYRLTWGRPGCI